MARTARKSASMARTSTKDKVETISTERTVNGFTLRSVPLPDSTAGRPNKWPFASMQVGESFEILGDKTANAARSSIAKFQQRNPGTRYVVRTLRTQEDGQRVFGVWRVEDVTPAK